MILGDKVPSPSVMVLLFDVVLMTYLDIYSPCFPIRSDQLNSGNPDLWHYAYQGSIVSLDLIGGITSKMQLIHLSVYGHPANSRGEAVSAPHSHSSCSKAGKLNF